MNWKPYAKKREFIDVLHYDGSSESMEALVSFLPDNVERERNGKGEISGNLIVHSPVHPLGKTFCYAGGYIVRYANGAIEGAIPQLIESIYEEVMNGPDIAEKEIEILNAEIKEGTKRIASLESAAIFTETQIQGYEEAVQGYRKQIIELTEKLKEFDDKGEEALKG